MDAKNTQYIMLVLTRVFDGTLYNILNVLKFQEYPIIQYCSMFFKNVFVANYVFITRFHSTDDYKFYPLNSEVNYKFRNEIVNLVKVYLNVRSIFQLQNLFKTFLKFR